MLKSIRNSRFLRMFLGILVPLFATAPLVAGCEEEGPAEELGKTIDEAAEEAGDEMEEAADELEEATDNK